MMEEAHTTTDGDIKEMDTKEVEDIKDILPQDEPKDFDARKENQVPSPQQEEVIKKKYGGLLPKKPPLISKDHEHAFFDSADWALGKKSKGPLEALRPKLQPSPHHQARSRSAYASGNDGEDVANSDDNVNPENPSPETESSNLSPENQDHQT